MKTRQREFQKGIVIPFVVIVFVVATALAGIMYSLFSVNLKQAVSQQKDIQAYYCTLTGINMAEGALFMDSQSLFDEFVSYPDKVLEDTISILPDGSVSSSLTGGSSVTVTVSVESKPDRPGNWVRIEATGTYVDEIGRSYVNRGSMWYRTDDPAVYEQDLGV